MTSDKRRPKPRHGSKTDDVPQRGDSTQDTPAGPILKGGKEGLKDRGRPSKKRKQDTSDESDSSVNRGVEQKRKKKVTTKPSDRAQPYDI